ncbi:MAG TPA: histidinol-phosphatase HisJ family protein [Kiritimatiellia bacterium]|nr:histidinol-phosphatase HisJ family protein [Kiritimatiellia bacterium]HMP34874.1 histidinol-phosphatase HisJ family protein [Kiritimatiellia bacterium]
MDPSIAALLPDYHTHHELCRHATGRTVDYARSAAVAGLREIASTDHCPTDVGFGQEHRMTLDAFDQYVADVEEARREVTAVTVRFGIEADFFPGCEAFLSDFMARYPLDIVLGSIHFRDYWSNNPQRRGLSEGPAEQVWREYYDLTGRLADSGLYDVVTHTDLPKRFGMPSDPDQIADVAIPALDRIARAGMAIEINTSGWIHSIREAYPSRHVLRWAAERGIGLVFGSDAHSPDRVGDGFEEALQLAREAGFTEARRYAGRRWTTYPLPG